MYNVYGSTVPQCSKAAIFLKIKNECEQCLLDTMTQVEISTRFSNNKTAVVAV